MRCGGDKAIHMGAKIKLHQLTVLQFNFWLAGQRRKVAHAVVDGNAGGHGNTLLNILLRLKQFSGELQQPLVAQRAKVANVNALLGLGY